MKKLLLGYLGLSALFFVTDTAFGAQRLKSSQGKLSTVENPFSIMYRCESKKFNDLFDLVTSHKPLFIAGRLNCCEMTRDYLEINNLNITDFMEYLVFPIHNAFFTEEQQYIQDREKAHKYLAHLQEILRCLQEEEALKQ